MIRPLLTTTRRQVENYLAYYGLPHVETPPTRMTVIAATESDTR